MHIQTVKFYRTREDRAAGKVGVGLMINGSQLILDAETGQPISSHIECYWVTEHFVINLTPIFRNMANTHKPSDRR